MLASSLIDSLPLTCSLGEGYSHSAALMFKLECAVRHGYTSVTSNLCGWNQVYSTKVYAELSQSAFLFYVHTIELLQ